jgi:hypothetical protein
MLCLVNPPVIYLFYCPFPFSTTITPKCLHKVSEQQIHTLTVNRTSMRQGVDGQPSALMVDIPIY